MPHLLDDLFQWASQQPPQNSTIVQLAMASNELTRNNLVSYGKGTLFYHPARFTGFVLIQASFASKPNGITQYFSDRLSGTAPFDPNNTDPLDVKITPPFLQGQYEISVHSSKWNFGFNFNPSFDAATGIILGSNGPTLITMSLCDRSSAIAK